RMEKKFRKNKFDMNDLLDNLQKVRKLGPLKDVLGMLPGVGSQLKDVDIDEHQFDRIQALILSMTPKEREKPEILDASRKRRIAAGAGQKVEDVNRLLAQYKQMQKMFKQMNSKKARKQLQRLTANGNMDGLKDLDITKLGM
ncbi:MAG: signal recognition particle protein, partial [Acutalibacteraceae bacterium]|nr:signal recognition particle protein [Acutalibacteraceae bacterium]